MSDKRASDQAYWKANVRLMTICLIIWAVVSFGFGLVLRPLLSGISIGGADLGFWFAQQGSIWVFLILIFFYAIRMNALDREFGVQEDT
ncbi:MAG: DUF4212 domain-containing protein [Geminicoccaceae bacterium]